MKFFAQLAIAATLLFAASAALSLWLNQSKLIDTGDKDAKEKDRPTRKADRDPERAERDTREPKAAPKIIDPPATVSPDSSAAALRDREDRLARRAAQVDLILRDLQAEREAVDALMKQVNTELKLATARANEPPAPPAAAAGPADAAADRKNVQQIAAMYDSMPAESAALILKQMADSGRLDTAVRVLSQMKDRQAARVLAELNDPTLAAQLIERMRTLKTNPPPAAPGPAPRPPS